MKTFHVDLQAHYAQPVTALAEAWRVTRRDAQVFGWCTASDDVTIDGVLYRASEGLTSTSAHTTNDLSVDSLDVSCFMKESTELGIASGLWDESEVVHFEYMWDDPPTVLDETDKCHIKRAGTLGRVQRQNLMLTAELRGLAEAFQTRIGRQYSPDCHWRHAIWNGTTYVSSVECGVDLAALGFIHDGSVTAVGADATLIFSDSASTVPVDEYAQGNNGLVTPTSGPNEGVTREVLQWTGAEFTMLRPFPYPLTVGVTYRAVVGDLKTKAACKDIYLNYINFGGFADIPGQDFAYQTPAGF